MKDAYVEDHMSGRTRVPDRKFTAFFGLFPVQVKFNHRVFGFSNDYHGPFKVVVQDCEGKFHMLASRFTEDALRSLVWR
jgi:hypothetical protein